MKKEKPKQQVQVKEKKTSIEERLKSIKDDVLSLKSKKTKAKDENKTEKPKKKKEVKTTEVAVVNETKIKKVKKSKNDLEKMYVIPLGGLEEVGKNCTIVQYKDEIIIIDAGAIFPDENLPGIDLVIPDYSFLENKNLKLKVYL